MEGPAETLVFLVQNVDIYKSGRGVEVKKSLGMELL